MNPASFPVMGLAALVSSPALYNGLVTGTLPIDQMLIRYLIAVAAVWAGLSFVAMVVGAPKAPEPAPIPQPATPDEAAPAA